MIIVPAVSDAEAKEKYPQGWKSPKPYIRIVAAAPVALPRPARLPGGPGTTARGR